jgi:feruloyl esterase
MFKRVLPFLVAAVAMLGLTLPALEGGRPETASASAPPPTLSAAGCTALTGLIVPDTTISSATVVPAAGPLPEHCLVLGHVDTEINFALRLPTTAWNRKLYHVGGGGFVGSIPDVPTGLARGYATVGTDTGHVGGLFDGSWALGRPDRLLNFGYRAVHVVTVAAKQIVAGAYGEGPRYSYFEGFSNGGRQGLMEAQRYPDDFDGIIAGAPVLDITGTTIAFNYYFQALATAPIPPTKLSALAQAVVAKCDAKDGLVDGLLDNPRRCRFDPAVLTCAAGDAPDCLIPAQVEVVRKVYAGPVNATGAQIHPGFAPGAEDGLWGWELWLTGGTLIPPPVGLGFFVQDEFLKHFVFGDAGYNSMTFNFDTDVAAVESVGPILNATDPDLSAFRAGGGKLLLWHGWSDHSVTQDRTIEYYNAVFGAMGKNKVDGFLRLFMAPGMDHFPGTGTGLNSFDALTALEDWVERGIAPDSLLASHVGPGVARTRPLCAYPKVAIYDGSGDINAAANFDCKQRGLGYAIPGFD